MPPEGSNDTPHDDPDVIAEVLAAVRAALLTHPREEDEAYVNGWYEALQVVSWPLAARGFRVPIEEWRETLSRLATPREGLEDAYERATRKP